MRKVWIILGLAAAVSGTAVELTVDKAVFIEETHRLGLNFGTWTTWGAEQLCQNIIMNPGFEGRLDRIAVIVTRHGSDTFSDERGLGSPDGYWKGATYDIRSGPSAGQKGKIVDSYNVGERGLPQYFTAGPLPPIDEKDVIAITKFDDGGDTVPMWWIPEMSKHLVYPDPDERRPGSPGTQSAVLMPEVGYWVELQYYLDALPVRAGKLLLIDGKWKFSIWAKSDEAGNTLHILFKRLNGTTPFLSEVITLTDEWEEYSFEFTGEDDGTPEVLKLGLIARGTTGSRIWIDDLYLGKAEPTGTEFRAEDFDAIRRMHLEYLRDHQGQIGDWLPNRLKGPWGRKAFRYRVTGAEPQWWFGYSVPSFFDFNEMVGTKPWIIMPSVLSDEEWRELGEFLIEHAAKERFDEVFVEFGNENWNWIFRGAGIPYPEICGKVADRGFRILKETVGDKVNLCCIIQGQFAAPDIALSFGAHTPSADMLAVAPYFFYTMDIGAEEMPTLRRIFLEAEPQNVALISRGTFAQGKRYGFYEVNLHATEGTAPGYERDGIVAGKGSGAALAKRLMQGVENRANPMMVFVFPGFDAHLANMDDYTRLWGVVRDLSPTQRLRPSGIAIAMMDHALGGKLHKIRGSSLPMTTAAFRDEKGWKALFASENNKSLDLEVEFPDDGGALPYEALTLYAATPFDTNEVRKRVIAVSRPLEKAGRKVRFTLPPFSLVVLPSKHVEIFVEPQKEDEEGSG